MIEYFPDPYPDEVLFSVWARFSDSVRYSSRDSVLLELFGSIHVSPVVDLPCHLGYFVTHLPFGHSYTVDSLISKHTLFPFYAPFLSQDRLRRLKDQMISDNAVSVTKLVGNLGNATTTTTTPPWFRYCPVCVEADRASFGECYWHRLHQVRGVEICPLHEVFLENSEVPLKNDSRIERMQFVSAEQVIRSVRPREATRSSLNDHLLDIARAVSTLLHHSFLPLDDQFLRGQYHALLAQRGLMTAQGLVRAGEVLRAFAEYYPLELLSLLGCEIHQTYASKKTWIYTLMQLNDVARHPLHHILFIHFLGSTVEAIFVKKIPYPQPFGKGPWPCLNPVCEHYREKCIPICQVRGTNGQNGLVGRFSCSCGFVYSRSGPDHSTEDQYRRDAILDFGSVWEAKLRELWFDTTLKLQDIARQLGVSTSTASRSADRLHLPIPRPSRWAHRPGITSIKKHTKDLSWYRTQWSALVSAAPDESNKALCRKLPGVSWWLRTHDIEWFMAHRPPLRKNQKSKNQIPLPFQSPQNQPLGENAAIGDASTAIAVKACAQKIMNDPGRPTRVTMRRLSIAIPELLYFKRHGAVLTTQALQEVVETVETFAVRRIRWFVRKCLEEQVCPTRRKFLRNLYLDHVLHDQRVQIAFDEAMVTLSSIK